MSLTGRDCASAGCDWCGLTGHCMEGSSDPATSAPCGPFAWCVLGFFLRKKICVCVVLCVDCAGRVLVSCVFDWCVRKAAFLD